MLKKRKLYGFRVISNWAFVVFKLFPVESNSKYEYSKNVMYSNKVEYPT